MNAIQPNGHAARDQREPPPDERLAEVVGVAAPAPQPAVHDAAARLARLGEERRELPVGGGLEEEARRTVTTRPATVSGSGEAVGEAASTMIGVETSSMKKPCSRKTCR